MGAKPRHISSLRGFERFLVRHGTRRVDVRELRRRIPARVALPRSAAPFLPSTELLARYGVPLPRPLCDLYALADRLAIEDYRTELNGWKYLRVGPGGWEPPSAKIGLPLLREYVRRFQWNAFSNMQLWEAFVGVACLGWLSDGNRVYASIISGEDAPVLWMDRERAQLGGYVASGLAQFLDERTGPPPAAKSRRGPPSRVPPHQDPRFLQGRAHWLVALLAWGSEGVKEADHALTRDRTSSSDYVAEESYLSSTIAAPAYWLCRSFFRGEDDLFQTTLAATSSNPSPLVQSFRINLQERLAEKPAKTFLAKMRRRYAASSARRGR